MGWAVKRPDGTYRAWNANAQDTSLYSGEVWEALETPPVITTPMVLSPLAQALDAALAGPVPTLAQIRAVLQAWRNQVS